MGEWREVTTKQEAITARNEIIDSQNYKAVLLVWWTPEPPDDFIEEAKDRSTVTAWRAGIWIKEEVELPDRLKKEDYNVGNNHCAVMLKLKEHFKPVEYFEPDDARKIDPAFVKPDC